MSLVSGSFCLKTASFSFAATPFLFFRLRTLHKSTGLASFAAPFFELNYIGPNSNSRSINESTRCQHRIATGKRCRFRVSDARSGLCSRPASCQIAPQDADLRAAPVGGLQDFKSASEINDFLSRLLPLLSGDRITPALALSGPMPAISSCALSWPRTARQAAIVPTTIPESISRACANRSKPPSLSNRWSLAPGTFSRELELARLRAPGDLQIAPAPRIFLRFSRNPIRDTKACRGP